MQNRKGKINQITSLPKVHEQIKAIYLISTGSKLADFWWEFSIICIL